MTTTEAPSQPAGARPTTIPARQAALLSTSRTEQKGNIVVSWMTTTDHKTIGYLYLITSFLFFCFGGVLALLIRAELFEPGVQIVNSSEQLNQLFTMHGTIMLLLFATPLFVGFGNVLVPLHIGAPDAGVPTTEHVRLLAVRLRWIDGRGRLPHPAWCRELRLDRVRAAGRRHLQRRSGRRPVGDGAWR